MTVRFNYADRKFNGVNKTILKNMVIRIFKEEELALKHIDYIFCSDEFLLNINRSALNHDYYTDIITFPLSNKNQPIVAEIYVSVDRVKDNATQLHQTFAQELSRVIAHGALHLCGYKDKTKKNITEIRSKEDYYTANM